MRKNPHPRATGFFKGPKLQVNNEHILPPLATFSDDFLYPNVSTANRWMAENEKDRTCEINTLTFRLAHLYSYFDKLASLKLRPSDQPTDQYK